MIFPLVQDFADALAVMPNKHPRRSLVELIDEAVRRDVHFIDRRPTTLFQCVWNTGRWADDGAAPESPAESAGWWAKVKMALGMSARPARPRRETPADMLERWRAAKDAATPGFLWARALGPPPTPPGGPLVAQYRVHEEDLLAAAVSPDGRFVAGGDAGGTVVVLDAETGAERFRFRPHDDRPQISCLAFDATSSILACADRDAVYRVNARTGLAAAPPVSPPLPETEPGAYNLDCYVTGLAFSPADGRMLTLSAGCVCVWDAADAPTLLPVRGVWSAAFSPDGLRVSCGHIRGMTVWDIDGQAEVCRGDQGGSYEESLARQGVSRIAFSPDGHRVVTGGQDGTVRIWDAADGRLLHALTGHRETPDAGVADGRPPSQVTVNDAAYSPDGRRIVSGADDDTVRVWDAETGAQLFRFDGHDAAVRAVAFTPDGQSVVSASADRTICVWRADRAGGAAAPPAQHFLLVTGAVFSPDGRRLLTSSLDGTVGVWDVESGALVRRLSGHDGRAAGVAWTPLPGRVLSCGYDNTVRVWDVETAACLEVVPGDPTRGTVALWNEDLLAWDGMGRLRESEAYRRAVAAAARPRIPDPKPTKKAARRAAPPPPAAPATAALETALLLRGGVAAAWFPRPNQLHSIDPRTGDYAPRVSAHAATGTWAVVERRFVRLVRLEGDRPPPAAGK